MPFRMPYILPSAKHPALRLPGTTRLSLRLSMAHSERKKQKNLAFLSQISELEVNLEHAAHWENERHQLQREQEELLEHAEQNRIVYESELNEYQIKMSSNASEMQRIRQRLTALERTNNYLSKIENMDTATRRQFASIQEQLTNLRTEQAQLIQESTQIPTIISQIEERYSAYCNEINNELASNRLAIDRYSQELSIVLTAIDGRTHADLELMRQQAHQRVDHIYRKEQFLLTNEQSEGRHPDHVIKLPITRDGWPFHLDEIKILEAMEEEHSVQYSFVFHNCSTSVKRCLLAGISDDLREQLLETGLNESFFHIKKIETCKGLRDWARELEKSLIQLNFSPDENTIPAFASPAPRR